MKKESTIKKDYKHWISNISSAFKQSQIKAATFVNSTMMRFYYCLGHDICGRMKENKYGNNFYKKLSLDLRKELPDVHSFSETNLKYMVYFYKLYSNKDLNNYNGDLLISQQDVAKFDTKKLPQLDAKSDVPIRQQLVDELNNKVSPQVRRKMNFINRPNLRTNLITEFFCNLWKNSIYLHSIYLGDIILLLLINVSEIKIKHYSL